MYQSDSSSDERYDINNRNEATRKLVLHLADYLEECELFNYLSIEADGVALPVVENEKHFFVSKALDREALVQAKHLLVICSPAYSFGGLDFKERFQKEFEENDIKANCVFKYSEYYDSNPGAGLYLYDREGFHDYSDVSNAEISDFSEDLFWFCWTNDFSFSMDEKDKDEQAYLKARDLMVRYAELTQKYWEKEFRSSFDDDWTEYGELYFSGSCTVKTSDIPELRKIFEEAAALVNATPKLQYGLEFVAVPDDEKCENFGAFRVSVEEGKFETSMCKF